LNFAGELIGSSTLYSAKRMKHIQTEIIINAAPEKIWSIIDDYPAYHSWNPFITKISGDKLVGGNLEVMIQLPGKKLMSFRPRILKYEPNSELRWKGKALLPGLFDGEHYFMIEEIEEAKCRFIHGEKFAGILVPLFNNVLIDTEKGFGLMNDSLKTLVEKQEVY